MRLIKYIFGPISVVLTLGFIFATPVGAQTSTNNAAQGLQVSPTRVELNAARGKTYNITISVMNVTAADLVYKSTVEDFNAANETGSPHIFVDTSLNNTLSIRNWVLVVPSFSLRSRQSKVINVQITIPNDAEPGGHYGVLLFSGNAPDVETNGVGLSASNGPLILIRVDGKITEQAELASFYTFKGDKQTSLFEGGPISFAVRVRNTGNIHVKPVGSVEVRDMFGGLVTTIPVNKEQSNVLPRSIRRFDVSFDKAWMFGQYTANLTLGYGATGQAITSTVTFWVIPYKLIAIGLLVLAVLIYIFLKAIKVYNRHIILKSKNENKKKHIRN